jgi:hypothetical protein
MALTNEETAAKVLRERGKLWLERALRKLNEGSLVTAMNNARDAAACLEACWSIEGAKVQPTTAANEEPGPEKDVPF